MAGSRGLGDGFKRHGHRLGGLAGIVQPFEPDDPPLALLYPDLLAGCEGSNAETQRARRDAEKGERKSSFPLRCSAPSASLR